jgi:poly-beta-1,6-N-acetyl-D-glucosamine biosynthesis protein PgaD
MIDDNDRFIIDESSQLQTGQKATAWGITILFWGAFLYLLQPILSIIAWWLNIRIFYHQMLLLGGYQAFVETSIFYITVIAILGGSLILWGRINLWRFKDKETRLASRVADNTAIAADFGVDLDQLNRFQQQKKIYLRFDEDGKVVDIES